MRRFDLLAKQTPVVVSAAFIYIGQCGESNVGFPEPSYDRESGLWYNSDQDYEASNGRYTRSDPMGLEGGINTFAYANGNPVGNT